MISNVESFYNYLFSLTSRSRASSVSEASARQSGYSGGKSEKSHDDSKGGQ